MCSVLIHFSFVVACADTSNKTPETPAPSDDNKGITETLEGVYHEINKEAEKVMADPDKYKDKIEEISKDIKNDPVEAFKKAGLGSFLEPEYTSIPFGLGFIAVGLLLTFMGRRIFKMFLGISGFVVGGSSALFVLIKLSMLIGFNPSRTVYWVVGIIGGLLGSLLFNKAWKWAVYCLSAYGGVMVGFWILGMINGTALNQYVERNTFLFIFAAIGVFLANYVDEFIIITASSLTGAFTCVFGFDLMKFVGFRAFVKNAIDSTPINLVDHIMEHVQSDIRICMIVALFIAVCGIYVQYRHQPRSYDRD